MHDDSLDFNPPLTDFEQQRRQQYARYKVGDAVIVNTAHLSGERHHYCPESNTHELYLNPSMIAKSGRTALIVEVEPCRYGDYYSINIHSGFVYTTDFLLPAESLTNKQLSSMFLEKS